jgi:hypothetical protein
MTTETHLAMEAAKRGGGRAATAAKATKTSPKRPDDRGYWMIKDNAITREWKQFIKNAAGSREMGVYHWIVTVLTREAKRALGETVTEEPKMSDVMARLDQIASRLEEIAARRPAEPAAEPQPSPPPQKAADDTAQQLLDAVARFLAEVQGRK